MGPFFIGGSTEDHSIFDFKNIVDSRSGWAEVIVTRGCPYSCSYCFNKPLINEYRRDLSKNGLADANIRGFTQRRRKVDTVISMLKEMKSTYPNIKGFTFVDDIMAQNSQWFKEFSYRYRSEINLPYACTSHPLLFNERLAKLLKDSGCKVIKMGVEAGNEEIREKVLKRDIRNAHLEKVFKIAREYGLKPQAFNMIGIPGETFENIKETISFNAKLTPYIVWLSTFNPYPGTELYKKCIDENIIDYSKFDLVESYREDSVLKDEILPFLEFKKIRVMFRWYLNSYLRNEAEKDYQNNIKELSALPEDHWRDGTAEKIFFERDKELDNHFRQKKIDHYVKKKYINIYWSKIYNYDLT